jgi:hypothetical protein
MYKDFSSCDKFELLLYCSVRNSQISTVAAAAPLFQRDSGKEQIYAFIQAQK